LELELTEDQEFFLATTRKFLTAEAPSTVVRALEHEPAGFAAEFWRRGAELGWTSLLVPEADGGGSVGEHGLLDLVLVAEEMGRRVAPGPLSPVNLVASAVAAGGTPAHKDAVLPGLLAGEAVAAWTGPTLIDAEVDPAGDGYRLTGVASPVEAGAQARHLLVGARSPDGPTLFLVGPDLAGISVTPLDGLDLVRRYAEVRFDGARVAASALVGTAGGAAGEIERLWQTACVLQCAETVGAIDHVFGMTLEYLGDRYSFGRPLSSYQALKHRVADDKMWLEACHATSTAAARAVATRASDAAEVVSAAKAWIGPRATELIQDCVQLHGGIGVTWEHDLHLYLRRATVNRITYGTPEEHGERIAARMLEEAS
jgi:alkylation response protein AidB-like acyl-CoA dehydrogenase